MVSIKISDENFRKFKKNNKKFPKIRRCMRIRCRFFPVQSETRVCIVAENVVTVHVPTVIEDGQVE